MATSVCRGSNIPQDTGLVKVMCEGRFDIIPLVKALDMEAAGMLIAECNFGVGHCALSNHDKARQFASVIANRWVTQPDYPVQPQESEVRHLGMAENELGNQD